MSMDAVIRMQERRSVRTIDPDRQIPEDVLNELMKVAINSPTALNLQRFHFTVLQDAGLLEHMAGLIRDNMLVNGNEMQKKKASTPGYSPLHHAPTLIFISGETGASSYVQTDCGIAAGMITAAAEELGLAACITGSSLFMFETEEGEALKKTLGIADNYNTVITVAVGYLKGEKPQPPVKKTAEELITYVR